MANPSRISKLLSLMLRHRPDEFGLEIDAYGYVPLDQVVQEVQKRYAEVTEAEIVSLVKAPEQYRFELNEFGIRALYGHSFFVDMDGEPMDPPPDRLYMGTTRGAARHFAREGISAGDRYYVHLSLTREAAESHSHQRDTPCVVEIRAVKAHEEGCRFFARGTVVLTEEIPASCIGPIHGSQQNALNVAAMPAPGGVSYGRKPRFSPR